jgi:hypothetical protein
MIAFIRKGGRMKRRVDICMQCGEEKELATCELCYACYRRRERAIKGSEAGFSPAGELRRQKRMAKSYSAMEQSLLDFGAGSHASADRLIRMLGAYLPALAGYLGESKPEDEDAALEAGGIPVTERDAGVNGDDVCSRSQESHSVTGDAAVECIRSHTETAQSTGAAGHDRVNVNSNQACSRSQELPGVIGGSPEAGKRDDPDHAAGYGVALDCAEDDAVDYGAFNPAVAVGDGNGNGCQAQQEDVPGSEAPVLGHEAHGTSSLEVTETADAEGPPPAMPEPRKRAKYPPVPIVLEDGRCGHLVAGMGERTKRTVYGVRLEAGGRVQVPKKAYGSPASLKRLSFVPKAWLVDGGLPHDKVPEFLKGQVPSQESGSGEY